MAWCLVRHGMVGVWNGRGLVWHGMVEVWYDMT